MPGRASRAQTVASCAVLPPHDTTAPCLTASPARREVIGMAKNTRQTSAKAATAASKTLTSRKATAAAKTAAASALSQTPSRRRGSK